MLRVLYIVIIVLAVATLLTRAAAARRALWVMLALAVLYTVLKLTGGIEALAPDRTGVFRHRGHNLLIS